jgi:hypothetical protein
MYINDETKKEAYKGFNRFLKDKGVFSRYYKILKSNPDGYFKSFYRSDIKYFLNNCEPSNWLTSCFVWSRQIEGHDFWGELHKEWTRTWYNAWVHKFKK